MHARRSSRGQARAGAQGRPPTELDQKFVIGGSDQEVDLVIIFLVIIAIAWMRKG
jgi:hypothetical protein